MHYPPALVAVGPILLHDNFSSGHIALIKAPHTFTTFGFATSKTILLDNVSVLILACPH